MIEIPQITNIDLNCETISKMHMYDQQKAERVFKTRHMLQQNSKNKIFSFLHDIIKRYHFQLIIFTNLTIPPKVFLIQMMNKEYYKQFRHI